MEGSIHFRDSKKYVTSESSLKKQDKKNKRYKLGLEKVPENKEI